ncbi:hypothetical protein FACS1894181_07970 [Bacteroidia bacterium]|nr:hypothetical protein FACS1894181_07970 [Bacteroidia bacterium]
MSFFEVLYLKIKSQKYMPTKRFNLLILLLIIIGLGSCGQKDPPPVEDPPIVIPGDTIEVPRDTVVMPPQTGEPVIFDKNIIGKWEMIAEEHEENRIVPVETDGSYMEFLGNGVLLFFPSGYGETYQTDSVYLYRYFRYIDEIALPHLIYEYTLINRDTLKLKEFYSVDKRMLYPYLFIYQRKKE